MSLLSLRQAASKRECLLKLIYYVGMCLKTLAYDGKPVSVSWICGNL